MKAVEMRGDETYRDEIAKVKELIIEK